MPQIYLKKNDVELLKEILTKNCKFKTAEKHMFGFDRERRDLRDELVKKLDQIIKGRKKHESNRGKGEPK